MCDVFFLDPTPQRFLKTTHEPVPVPGEHRKVLIFLQPIFGEQVKVVFRYLAFTESSLFILA